MTRQILTFALILIIVILGGCYADSVAHEELTTLARVVIVSAGVVVAVGVTGAVVVLSFVFYERLRVIRARRLLAEREADVQVVTAPMDHQVYIREDNRHAVWRAAHLDSAVRANGKPVPVTPDEERRWSAWQIARMPGRAAEVLALPEPEPEPLPEVVNLADYVQTPMLRRVFLGVGRLPDGRVQQISAPLASLVHIAAGGASGFGKSTFIQALAWQILNAREEPRPVFLDPQAVTFSPFSGDERLWLPVATTAADITAALGELVAEMQRRQAEFGRWRGIQNLSQYNSVVSQEERLPSIPVLLDEFGLIGDDKEPARLTRLLSAGGRKSGISLIVGTQTWTHAQVSTAFRANLSTSVQFYARNASDSRVLLGDGCAASITRPGQAFARLPGQAGLVELQAPDPSAFVDVEPVLLPEPAYHVKPVVDTADEQFRQLVEAGTSRSQAAREAYNRPYAGSIVHRGKQALGEI